MKYPLIRATLLAACGLALDTPLWGEAPPAVAGIIAPSTQPATQPATRPALKELSENVKKALDWLVKNQQAKGAWSQGEESQAMGGGMEKVKDAPNVADTCMAAMALMRPGSTPKHGPYADHLSKAVDFVCAEVEHADEKSLYVTQLQGTRTQTKLGTYIDTFLAARLLSEVKDDMPSQENTKRVNDALAKVIKKIELNQKDDGRWANVGWAPVLAQAEASKALNLASAKGATVSEATRLRVEQVAMADFNASSAAARIQRAGSNVGGSSATGSTGPLAKPIAGGDVGGAVATTLAPTVARALRLATPRRCRRQPCSAPARAMPASPCIPPALRSPPCKHLPTSMPPSAACTKTSSKIPPPARPRKWTKPERCWHASTPATPS